MLLAAIAACGGREEPSGPVQPRDAPPAVRAIPPPPVARPQAPPAGPPADDVGLPPQVPVRAAETARAADVRVIRRWLAAQRAGHLRRAARSWRLPARYQNGSAVITVDETKARMALVASFRCGSRLAEAGGAGAFVVVRLRVAAPLGERCRAHVGDVARAAIRVNYGQISEYYRLPDDPAAEPRRQRPHPASVGGGADSTA
jgi:hypothetical protein